jgi:hypothetical protein
MEPTVQQLRSFYRMSLMASNTFKPINLIRLDERTNRIVMLVAQTIQIEIFPNGEVLIQ